MRARKLALAFVLAVGCSCGAAEPTPVRVETVVPERIAPTLVVPGVIEARSERGLGFRVEGFVERFGVGPEVWVEAGTVLAELDRTDLARAVERGRAAIASARAKVREAEFATARATGVKAGESAQLRLEVQRAELRLAELELDVARSRLARSTLRAPVAGRVTARLAAEGDHVAAGQPVVVLAELARVRARTGASAAAVRRVRLGAEAVVHGLDASERRGRVTRVSAVGEIEVEVDNRDGALRPGTPVQVAFALGPARFAHSVPAAAVLRGVGGQPISLVVRGERIFARPVSLGSVRGGRVVVRAGLASGDRVVTEGQLLVTVGDRVRVIHRK